MPCPQEMSGFKKRVTHTHTHGYMHKNNSGKAHEEIVTAAVATDRSGVGLGRKNAADFSFAIFLYD